MDKYNYMQFQKRIEIAYNYSGIIPFITGPHTTPHMHFKSPATVLSCAMCGKTHYCSVHYFHHFSPVISQWVFQISYQMIYQPLEDSGVWQSSHCRAVQAQGSSHGQCAWHKRTISILPKFGKSKYHMKE